MELKQRLYYILGVCFILIFIPTLEIFAQNQGTRPSAGSPSNTWITIERTESDTKLQLSSIDDEDEYFEDSNIIKTNLYGGLSYNVFHKFFFDIDTGFLRLNGTDERTEITSYGFGIRAEITYGNQDGLQLSAGIGKEMLLETIITGYSTLRSEKQYYRTSGESEVFFYKLIICLGNSYKLYANYIEEMLALKNEDFGKQKIISRGIGVEIGL